MNKKSKRLIKKRYIRFSNAKNSLKKNKRKIHAKKLISRRHRLNKSLRSKRIRRKYRRSQRRSQRRMRNINMSGGGIPFGGTIKGLLGLTHNTEQSRDNMIGNLCALNSVKPTSDTQLSGILNQVCNLNENVKKEKKDSGIIKGAMRLIGNVATLPLRTATGVVKNVTGFDASEAAYNAIKNTISKEEQSNQVKLLPQQPLTGGQPLVLNHNPQQPQIQSGINYNQYQHQHVPMQGGNQNNQNYSSSPIHDVDRLKSIEGTLASGGSLTQDEIQYISSL